MNKLWVKTVVWGLVLLLTTLTVLFIILLRPELWSNQILDYLNNSKLLQKGLNVQFDELKGNVFSSFKFKRFRLYDREKKELFACSLLKLEVSWKDLIARELNFSGIECDSPRFFFPELSDSLQSLFSDKQEGTFRFFKENWTIRKILLNSGEIYYSDSLQITNLNLFAGLFFEGDSLQIHSRFISLHIPDYKLNLNVSHLSSSLQGDTLNLHSVIAQVDEGEINLNGKLFLSAFSGNLELKAKKLPLYPYLSPFVGDLPIKDDRLSFSCSIEGKPSDFRLKSKFKGRLFSHAVDTGELTLYVNNSGFRIPALLVRSERTSFKIQSEFKSREMFTARVGITNLNVSDWLETELSSNLNGEIRLKGKGILTRSQPWTINLKLDQGSINNIALESISGKVLYRGGKWETLDTLSIFLGGSRFKFMGGGNLNNLAIDGRAEFNSPDFIRLSETLNLPEASGRSQGEILISGLITDPDIQGKIAITDFAYRDVDFRDINGNFKVRRFISERKGILNVHAKQGNLLTYPITAANVSVSLSGDTSEFSLIEIRNGADFIRANGEMVGFSYFYVNKWTSLYQGTRLMLESPLTVTLFQDTVVVNNAMFLFNDGKFQADLIYTPQSFAKGKIDFQQIQAEDIRKIVNSDFSLYGKFSGNLSVERKLNLLRGEGHLTAVNGQYGSLFFSRLMGDIFFTDDSLFISNLSFIDTSEAHVVFNGYIIPVADSTVKLGEASKIDGEALISSLPLSEYAPLIKFPFKVTGYLNGTMNFTGQLNDPVIQFSYQVESPGFERLKAASLTAKGRYEDFRSLFTEIIVQSDEGIYRGYGYLPLDLRLTRNHKVWLGDDPMDLTFTGQVKEFTPLENYMDELESLTGDIRLALSITGSPKHPIRNGNLSLKNAKVELASFENPLQNIQGSAIITNNRMDIVSCSAVMRQNKEASIWNKVLTFMTPGRNSTEKQNLSVAGSLNLKYFFNPEFNLTIKGNNLYVKTPLSEQEGVVDVDLSVSGRDTIIVEGEIFPEEFYVRNEFTSTAPSIPEEQKKGGKYYSYNIHVPIPGNVFFQNNEVDAELEGDLYLVRREREPITFSGTVNIRQGKFYYFRDEFEIKEGTIQFEPYEWNPKLYLKGVLDITPPSTANASSEEDYITITLTGDLKNPQIIFDSKDSKYSQSDIIALLTVNQTLYDDPFNPKKLQDESANVLGTFLEREIERNARLLSPFDVFDLRTTGNIFRPTELDVTSVLLGRRLSPNLYLTYERSLTFTDPAQQLGLEYRLSRTTSLVGEIDQTGLIHLRYRYKYHY